MRVLPCLPAFALALVALAVQPLPAQSGTGSSPDVPASDSPAPLGRTVASLLGTPEAGRAHWGIAVLTLDNRPVYSLNQGQLFRPASTAKLFTTAAAMALLGPSARTTSRVRFPAPDTTGTVTGDLVLEGGLDADLAAEQPAWTSHPHLPPPTPLRALDSFVTELIAHSVHHITGNILAPISWDPYPQGWAVEDMLWGYGAPVSSVSLNDNQLLLRVTGASSPGLPATVQLLPDTGFYRVEGSPVTTNADAKITVHHDPGNDALRVLGSVGVGEVYRTEIAVDDPALFAAQALRRALLAAGITVDGTARSPRTELPDASFLHHARLPLMLPQAAAVTASSQQPGFEPGSEIGSELGSELGSGSGFETLSHTGPALSQDVISTLKESLNLHAELLLRRLGGIAGDESTMEGARVEHQWLVNAGIQDREFVFFDGSGLSTKDLVTPRAEAQLLLYASRQPWFAQWRSAFPVGGVDGTLAARFTAPALKGRVLAKTGTLGESRALAGYLRCASGAEVAFSIMVDDHEPGTPADRVVMDSIVAAIAAAN